ncbi:hypothetical protein [Streptomyces phaeofaciens]
MALSDDELARAKKLRVEQVPLLRRSRGVTNETLLSCLTLRYDVRYGA